MSRWREIPGFAGYEMHSTTKQVRSWWNRSKHKRRADFPSEITPAPIRTPTGDYPAIRLTYHDRDGNPIGRTSRSVDSLYALTFPDLCPACGVD